MKCPYNLASQREVTQYINDFRYPDDPESNQIDGYQEITQTTYERAECLQEDCAAWVGGRCRYNGTPQYRD